MALPHSKENFNMAKRIGTRQFKERSEDGNKLDGITRRLNEWLHAQEASVRVINIETINLLSGTAIQVWYEVEDAN